MRNLRGRAKLRGIPLDNDCKKAKISLYEYGPDDNRKFCYGVCDGFTDEIAEKCRKCGAYAFNAEPPEN